MDDNEEDIKAKLSKVIDTQSKMLPESSRASADLWKFAKMHDRRSYQLLRFAMAADSNYRTVTKAIKELTKRIQGNSSATTTMLESLTPLVYRSSSLIFNRSHIRAIMKLSRTDEYGLGNTAHEMLRETSSQNPEVLEAHVQDMCKDLESQAPTAKQPDDPGVEEILKACAGFARKLPKKLPTHRSFHVSLTNYAMYSSSPRAAKHAVSIFMATTDKKQMHSKELVKKSVQKCKLGSDHFLTKLATISQLSLLAPKTADEESDAILNIATEQILFKNNTSGSHDSGYTWSSKADEETLAKEWALRILVNRIRAREPLENEQDFREQAEPVYTILNTLIAEQGELSQQRDTPATQKSRLRLLAAKSVLKLCSTRTVCDRMFEPGNFNALALVAQDPLLEVRTGFIGQLKKRLVQPPHLPPRWYTTAFLLAFEPNVNLYDSTLTWLRSRAAFFSRQSQSGSSRSSAAASDPHQQQTVMESLFSRLLSLLAHHPDYPLESADESSRADDLIDFARYILFFLAAVANENNLSLIFHIAQRVKQTRDAVTSRTAQKEISARLHTLSDFSQAVIRRFAEVYSQQHKIGGSGGSGAASVLQTYPGKMRLPSSLFANLASHDEAQDIAARNFLPGDVDDRLDRVVRTFMKPKNQSAAGRKRKVENANVDGKSGKGAAAAAGSKSSKRAKKERKGKSSSSAAGAVNLPRRSKKRGSGGGDDNEGDYSGDDKAAGGGTRRKSGRGTDKPGVSYNEGDSDEDDQQMEDWDQRPEKEESEGQEESGDEEEEQDVDEDVSDANAGRDKGDKSSEAPSSPPPPTKSASKAKRSASASSPVAGKGKGRRGKAPVAQSGKDKGNANGKQATRSTGRSLRSKN